MPLSCFLFWIALKPNTACACRISLSGKLIYFENPYALSAGRVRLPAQAHKKIAENFNFFLTSIVHSTIHSYTRYEAMAIQRAQPAQGEQPDRWEAQLRKGAVEMAALASLWQGRLYGLEIIRFLESQSQLALAEGTIYPILNRLKAEGMLTSEWVEAEAGHPRKYYSLTDAGRQRLRQMAEAWVSFSRGLSRLLEPVLQPQEKIQ
jgi:PadR family transcriptional regulator PadR